MRVATVVCCFLPISLLVSVQIAFPQSTLQPGNVVEKKIAAGQRHTYNITLQEDQYVRLVLDQKGIDLGVRVLDEDGRTVGEFDNPNAAEGPESISFIAERSGTYNIEIQPLDEFRNPAPGQYELRIVDLRKASDQELRTGRVQLALRTKGVILLNEIQLELSGLRNRLMRAGYETEIAGLLKSFDEKGATKLLLQAAETIRQCFEADSSLDPQTYHAAVRVRAKIAQQMMVNEPEMALSFLRSTRTPKSARYSGTPDTELELSISKYLVPRNPNAAFQIAEESLKSGFSESVLTTAEALKEKNPELAATIVHDIVTRLSDQPLIEIPSNASMASSLVQLVRTSGIPSAGGRRVDGNLISDVELRSLMQKIAAEIQSFKPTDSTASSFQRFTAIELIGTLKQWGNGMQIVSPEVLASMEQKLSATSSVQISLPEGVVVSRQYVSQEEATIASLRPAITNSISKHRFEDAFQLLEKLDSDYKQSLVASLVQEIGSGLKKSTALAFLERARRILPSSQRAQDEVELEGLLAFIPPYSSIDPNRGFEIVEPLVDQFNDLSIAALTMNGFSETYYQDGEFVVSGDNAVARMAHELSTALGRLAIANFQRAKADADRIRPLSVRIKMHLSIAARAITGEDNEDDDED